MRVLVGVEWNSVDLVIAAKKERRVCSFRGQACANSVTGLLSPCRTKKGARSETSSVSRLGRGVVAGTGTKGRVDHALAQWRAEAKCSCGRPVSSSWSSGLGPLLGDARSRMK